MYAARRYTRTAPGPHHCPDSGSNTHNLIPTPGEPNTWVCPYAYDQERGEEHQARLNAEAATERQARAERIAADIYAQGRSQRVESAENEVLAMLTAAALQALTEKENAR